MYSMLKPGRKVAFCNVFATEAGEEKTGEIKQSKTF